MTYWIEGVKKIVRIRFNTEPQLKMGLACSTFSAHPIAAATKLTVMSHEVPHGKNDNGYENKRKQDVHYRVEHSHSPF